MKCVVDQTARAFCARTLPKAEWTHYAHLRVGLWHLLQYSEDEALDLLRSRIRALNESHGVANSETGGYHESITRFYVWRIARFLDDQGRDRPVQELWEALLLECGDKSLPFCYWSRERLLSPEARLQWLEPDLEPLQHRRRT